MAFTGTAFAGDFSTTLHYPEAPVASRPAGGIDHSTTGSIIRTLVTGKPGTKKHAGSMPGTAANND